MEFGRGGRLPTGACPASPRARNVSTHLVSTNLSLIAFVIRGHPVSLKVLKLYLPNVRPDCEPLDGWPRIAGAEWAKSLQQYGEDSADLDSILLDSTTEFLS